MLTDILGMEHKHRCGSKHHVHMNVIRGIKVKDVIKNINKMLMAHDKKFEESDMFQKYVTTLVQQGNTD